MRHLPQHRVVVCVQLVVNSLKDRDMKVIKNESGWHAMTTIGGVEGEIKAIHVEMKSSWGMPKVDFVEIHGVNAAGEAMYEKKAG
jgi:hypothetical protein